MSYFTPLFYVAVITYASPDLSADVVDLCQLKRTMT